MTSTEIAILLAMLACLVGSAYFSATETAFSTFNRARMKNLAATGNTRAQKVLDVSQDYEKLLSTILIGNNIVNIALSTMATLLFVRYFLHYGATISTVVITVVVLIFGEITPKSAAKIKADSFAVSTVNVLHFFILLFTPLNFFFGLWKKVVRRMFKDDGSAVMTEEELITIVDEAEQDGGIDEEEGTLIRSAIEFGDSTAEEILTPRVDVIAIDIEMELAQIAPLFRNSGFSRLPVYRESLDNVIGVLHEKDYHALVQDGNNDWQSVLSKPVFVTQYTKISDLMQTFKKQKTHLAIVLDELGGTMGIVTMEDVLEELIGDIWDEHDTVVQEVTELSDGSYTVLGSTRLADFFEQFQIERTEQEWEELPQTVNGWLLMIFEGVPTQGASIETDNLSITVTKSDAQGIDEIRVQPINPATED